MEASQPLEAPLVPPVEAALRQLIAELELQLKAMEQVRLLANRKKNQAALEMKNLESGLQEFLNRDQIQRLKKKTTRGTPWTEKTLRKGLQLRLACGKRGYKLVRETAQPLPANHTLQHHLQSYKFKPGLLHDLMRAFALKLCLFLAIPKSFCLLAHLICTAFKLCLVKTCFFCRLGRWIQKNGMQP
ncbi:hypothetical protein HPB48_025168 [Haemaphysalis longicornis]|uniref:Uncharacterized protein n=1 Tax=Haemaphysalis longicornis TaxID=44386 RepID=A0A9J6GYR9_HAELO|nr:hypothetical protein HPB48_025168 [Haemaphysalis longicornis]